MKHISYEITGNQSQLVEQSWSAGPVDPSLQALSGVLKFSIRCHKFNKDFLSTRCWTKHIIFLRGQESQVPFRTREVPHALMVCKQIVLDDNPLGISHPHCPLHRLPEPLSTLPMLESTELARENWCRQPCSRRASRQPPRETAGSCVRDGGI